MRKLFNSSLITKSNKNTMPKLVSGFTLIELLVVIAIISLISSIVLAALNSARIKAADATIIADMNTIIKQTEIVYDDNNGSYISPNPVCSNVTIGKAMQSASMVTSKDWLTDGNNADYNCVSAINNNWRVVIKMKSGSYTWICADNGFTQTPKYPGTYKVILGASNADRPSYPGYVCP